MTDSSDRRLREVEKIVKITKGKNRRSLIKDTPGLMLNKKESFTVQLEFPISPRKDEQKEERKMKREIIF